MKLLSILSPLKPGLLTSELWLIAGAFGLNVANVHGAGNVTAGAIAYTAGRSLLKAIAALKTTDAPAVPPIGSLLDGLADYVTNRGPLIPPHPPTPPARMGGSGIPDTHDQAAAAADTPGGAPA